MVDDRIWIVRPDTAVRVGLLTVPCTVTGRPGRATCGLTAVMPTATCCGAAVAVRELAAREVTAGAVREVTPVEREVAAAAAVLPARAGPAPMSAANAQARTQRRASLGHAVLAGLWSRCVGH